MHVLHQAYKCLCKILPMPEEASSLVQTEVDFETFALLNSIELNMFGLHEFAELLKLLERIIPELKSNCIGSVSWSRR